MKYVFAAVGVCAALWGGLLVYSSFRSATLVPDVTPDMQGVVLTSKKQEVIRLESPLPDAAITSPLTVRGWARGTWYFEATFPLVLVDWDGRIIAEGYAQAQDEWMTDAFVPFVGTLEFVASVPEGAQEFMMRGALVLRKDNPSGLPEYDDAIEIPVVFGR